MAPFWRYLADLVLYKFTLIMGVFMKAVTVLMSILLGSSLSLAEGPCEKVKSVLKKSEYFKNVGNNQELLGYVMFQSTPVARVMYYSLNNRPEIVGKNDQGNIVGPVRLLSEGGKCIFVTEILGVQAKILGQEIKYSTADSVQFVVDPNDNDVFFRSSNLIAITDANELISVRKTFED
jgi:hypothetical protein